MLKHFSDGRFLNEVHNKVYLRNIMLLNKNKIKNKISQNINFILWY